MPHVFIVCQSSVNSEFFARVLSSRKLNPRKMAKLLCRLLMHVNQDVVANFNVTNSSFNAIRETKTLAKISEFTVRILESLVYKE